MHNTYYLNILQPTIVLLRKSLLLETYRNVSPNDMKIYDIWKTSTYKAENKLKDTQQKFDH